ncbi:sensor histidine kinase [Dactylosporangium aurantiacum]|uniref:histidine kinase n=1 Tax=Dactylosporangium aurantiacum TaxID=35754 RepID=A0A9Q9IGI0_9ACTN|nr:sensor histidine kinase [Dactylosporangium aurantiacum]MDG6101392.1 sensor histidine kinase [Dactylosporangium aurantiacum]UWZ52753.1 sensor histidine kinase [Dactylosporangium aurantiacum]
MLHRPSPTPLAVAAVSVVAVVGLASSGLLGRRWSPFLDDVGQFTAALAATVACWTTAGRHTGGQRWWRVWMGAGACGWMVGQFFWTWYRLVNHAGLPSPSYADAGYLTMPGFALLAIIVLAADRPTHGPPRRQRNLLIVLDGLMVVGALFALAWATALGAVVRTGAATPLAYSVAIAYPVTDLLLTIMIVLLVTTTATAPNRFQLVLLGAGLCSLSFSDTVFAYLVTKGANSMSPLANSGFVAGFALIAVAALTPAREGRRWPACPHAHWGHLLLPYVPVAGTVVLLVVQLVRDIGMDSVEVVAVTAVIGLLIVRQAVVLVDSANLVASRARLVLAADQTRRRLERDLHDGIQQRLISLGLDVRRIEATVPPDLPELREELVGLAEGLSGAVNDVRELSRGVHPAILVGGGLRPALGGLARRAAIPVELDVQVEGRLPEPVEVGAYYMVTEALTNAAKHAQATLVHVAVRVLDDYLRLTVSDDGVGGADPKRGTGLTGLIDRAEALGGKLTIESPAGRGTRLQADLPLGEP